MLLWILPTYLALTQNWTAAVIAACVSYIFDILKSTAKFVNSKKNKDEQINMLDLALVILVDPLFWFMWLPWVNKFAPLAS